MPPAFVAQAEALCRRHYALLCVALCVANFIGTQLVIRFVPYTKIDWPAYMQQVATIAQGNFNYSQIEGDTGPLVYPAGHVAAFSALRALTSAGDDVWVAQQIFAALHTVSLALALRLFGLVEELPRLLAPLLLLSRRTVSLFVLRLFNDAVQMPLIHAFLLLAAANRWTAACLLFSLAVSVKMNALLYAPGLAIVLCQAVGARRALRLAVTACLPPQLLLAAPFLHTDARAYASRAFEFTRVFLYRWTVNGAFLPEHVFRSGTLAALLLLAHVATLLALAQTRWSVRGAGLRRLLLSADAWRARPVRTLRPSHVLHVLCAANFVGVAFARTLHFQFYLWYVHLLPVLLARSRVPAVLRLAAVCVIEAAFNVDPPTARTAVALNVAHAVVLVGLFTAPRASDVFEKDSEVQVAQVVKKAS